MSNNRSALDALSAAEKAAVLDELLAARPDLRQPAEAFAARAMTNADRSAVAGDVEDSLQGLGIEELNIRAGYRPGRGYVHPAEAADEILDEALQPSESKRPSVECAQVMHADLRGHDLTDGQRTGAPGYALGVLR